MWNPSKRPSDTQAAVVGPRLLVPELLLAEYRVVVHEEPFVSQRNATPPLEHKPLDVDLEVPVLVVEHAPLEYVVVEVEPLVAPDEPPDAEVLERVALPINDEQPLATRDEVADMTSGALVKWDGVNEKLITSSANVGDDTHPVKIVSGAPVAVTDKLMKDKVTSSTVTVNGCTVTIVNLNDTIMTVSMFNQTPSATGDFVINLPFAYGTPVQSIISANGVSYGFVFGVAGWTTLTMRINTVAVNSGFNVTLIKQP